MYQNLFKQNRTGRIAPAPVQTSGGAGVARRAKRLLLSLALCAALPWSLSAQNLNISGTVTGSDGDPVVGASVVVKGSTVGAATGADGGYNIVAPAGATLVFSFLGLTTKEEAVAGRGRIDVMLSESNQAIGEVVVTALGIKKSSKALGYSVATVNAEELVRTGTSNFATALYGKTPGVRIQAAPGGATSAVSVNVRGLSSITGNNQPLVIIDGVPVRNGNANEKGYWDDQRINANGLVDINPEDIASISILKGASASALYGSEAANGVIMITSKSGKRSAGLGVEVNVSLSADQVAYMPKMQTTFGPGVHTMGRNDDAYQKSTGGFFERKLNGQMYKSIRTTTQQFGPKYDGSDVLYWDGKVRPYSAMSSNPWKDIFRAGFNQTYNVAITQGSERANTRFSYTLVSSRPTQYNSDYAKHNFNLTGSISLNSQLQVEYTASYIRQDIKNRPYRISRITNSFGGMFGSFEDVGLMREKTRTSLGYKNVFANANTPTPNESFFFQPGSWALLNEYYWNILGREQQEDNNRFIASVTPSYKILPGLTLRGRISTDLTADKMERMESTEAPLAYGSTTGYYQLTNKRYEIYYGDIMLSYDKELTEAIGLTANVGYQGRMENMYGASAMTDGGLSIENWFHINASKNQPKSKMDKTEFLKTAYFGTLSLAYNHALYLEGTVRQEQTSTLASGSNSFFYPSVNASYIFSEMLKDSRPSWFDYGKLRASYGIVGNAPEVYRANVAYEQAVAGASWVYNRSPKALGNETIHPEKKYEWEFGLEGKFLNNRLGFEMSYYTNTVKDQILQATMPQSSGGASILLNVGELANRGFELSLNGTPLLTQNCRLDLHGNIGFNRNKVVKLMDGLDELSHSTIDGAVEIKSLVGQPMGDIYAYVPKVDANGNKIVNSDGLYPTDYTKRRKVGNAMPDATGGFGASLGYKSWSLDAVLDFRIGGDIVNIPYQYMMGRGNIVESMPYRDAAHGGLTYYFEGDNLNIQSRRIAFSGDVGPNGERVYDNGMILPGVKENGTANDIIVPADYYYNSAYNWGASDPHVEYGHSVFDNSYLKVRELSISYRLPEAISHRFACRNLTLSIFGRNLFYVYRNLPAFDAEATDGTSWLSQVVIGGSTATTRTFGFSIRASF
jgi:TonB-linked SusC/RagA family outer membrane protein